MTKLFQSKGIIWFCLVVGVLAVVVIFVVRKPNGPQSTSTPPLEVTKQDLASSQLPELMPADMPMEQGAAVVQNYNATANDGRQQATRTFETAQTLDANFKTYTDYAKNNGWTLGTGVDQKNIKVVTATKGDLSLVVTISQNSGTQVRSVNITVTKNLTST